MCLSSGGKAMKLSFWGEKKTTIICSFHYLADDILYWLQPYAQSLLWTAGIQQEHSLVSSLWSQDRLCKPQEAKKTVVYHVVVKWRSTCLFTCVWGIVCVMKCACCAHTMWAGVELQTRLCWLQQSLYETMGEERGREDDGPLSLNLHRLHHTVRDQVLLVTWGHRHTWSYTHIHAKCKVLSYRFGVAFL